MLISLPAKSFYNYQAKGDNIVGKLFRYECIKQEAPAYTGQISAKEIQFADLKALFQAGSSLRIESAGERLKQEQWRRSERSHSLDAT